MQGSKEAVVGISLLFLNFLLLNLASTPDWVIEFAEKQAKQEKEDRMKVITEPL